MLVTTDRFAPLVGRLAVDHGAVAVRTVTLPHPLGGVEPAVVATRADSLIDAVLAALTGPLRGGAGKP